MRLFERVNQQAAIWVKDMQLELRLADDERACHALRAGLQALRDRMGVEEAAQLSAQLPLLIRGMFFEGWNPTGKPLRIRHREDFLALVREKYFPHRDASADDIVVALFKVLGRHVTAGEITDIMLTLPNEIVDVVSPRREDP